MDTLTKTRILIVEDDAHFRETLVDALSFKSLDVHSVATAAEARRELLVQTPSLIIMDVQLPDMHGFDLCRMLRRDSRFRDVPVVFLSARYTEPSDRAEGLLAGANAYLAKPVNPDALWKEVHYLLDRAA